MGDYFLEIATFYWSYITSVVQKSQKFNAQIERQLFVVAPKICE